MDNADAPEGHAEATPIFGAYRRGYDPEQVDRYVADQQRRLDEANTRASDAERRLAAAVGQLRELHRRVAVLESESRPVAQSAPLDTLGERVQRILQEAWEGAFALRQTAEQESLEIRERVAAEAKEIVASARRKAEVVEDEIDRRRRSYLQRLEEDRARAVQQVTFLAEQRKRAINELIRVKDVIETTVAEAAAPAEEADREVISAPVSESTEVRAEDPVGEAAVRILPNRTEHSGRAASSAPPKTSEPTAPTRDDARSTRTTLTTDEALPKTMPVHNLAGAAPKVPDESDRGRLVQNHRQTVMTARRQQSVATQGAHLHSSVRIFDFDESS